MGNAFPAAPQLSPSQGVRCDPEGTAQALQAEHSKHHKHTANSPGDTSILFGVEEADVRAKQPKHLLFNQR